MFFMNMNAPTFAYYTYYGELPNPPIMGRESAHPHKTIPGYPVPIDKEIPSSAILDLYKLEKDYKYIQITSSCQGSNERLLTFIIFRPLIQDEMFIKKLVNELNKYSDIKAAYDKGRMGYYRVCITNYLWYDKDNRNKFIKWWKTLPDKIKKTYEKILKQSSVYKKELKTSPLLKEIEKQQVIDYILKSFIIEEENQILQAIKKDSRSDTMIKESKELELIKHKIDKILKLTIPTIGFAIKKTNPNIDKTYQTIEYLLEPNLLQSYKSILNKHQFVNSFTLFKKYADSSLDDIKIKLKAAYVEIKNLLPDYIKRKNVNQLVKTTNKYIQESLTLEMSFKAIILSVLIFALLILSGTLYIIMKIIFSKNKQSKIYEKLNKKIKTLKNKLSFLPLNNAIGHLFISAIAMVQLWLSADDPEFLQYLVGKITLILFGLAVLLFIILTLLGIAIVGLFF